ncbi:MAG: hypothetical protein M1148_02770 [Candidatus Thermoplasmatota archaeon]|nr:hypothetical protein [Candidatus Thermoplasmatota archaeon]
MSENQQFQDIAVWKEDALGIIVIKSSDTGEVRRSVFPELVLALGMASADADLKAIVITGLNRNFVSKIEICGTLKCLLKTLDDLSALASMVYSAPKPVYTILTGNAVNMGYEIALLGDVVISGPDLKAGITEDYIFRLGGSLTSQRFSNISLSEPAESVNVDKIFQRKDLLGEAKSFILGDYMASRPLLRRRRLSDTRTALMEEHRLVIDTFSSIRKEGE